MTHRPTRRVITALALSAAMAAAALPRGSAAQTTATSSTATAGTSQECITCHEQETPGIVAQWRTSKHAKGGVACIDCHGAEDGDADGWTHHGQRIATIVTPQDCGGCHSDEAAQFAASHHARAAQFVGSLDNVLGEIVEGRLAAANGCLQCHGSTVAFQKDAAGKVMRTAEGKPVLDANTWPNSGIGRVNIDGSLGSCTACHTRHIFSSAQTRQPEVCGKCHMGPDHPQIEIYNESKHGIVYQARKADMHLDSDSWVVGKDYDAAPTCATCHVSATRTQPVTHDVGARISWTLRPVISKKLENADARRAAMKDVCSACHGPDFVNNFYASYDGTVELYNRKFAEPAQKIMDVLRAAGKITPTPFDDQIEWTFYHLWHHQGRRARMGASMQGPDYTQWHGFFEVAECFYFELLPEAKELAGGDPAVRKVIDEVEGMTEHQWRKGLSKEDIDAIQKFYQERYGGK